MEILRVLVEVQMTKEELDELLDKLQGKVKAPTRSRRAIAQAREDKILEMIRDGYSPREVSESLKITKSLVYHYMSLAKVKVQRRDTGKEADEHPGSLPDGLTSNKYDVILKHKETGKLVDFVLTARTSVEALHKIKEAYGEEYGIVSIK